HCRRRKTSCARSLPDWREAERRWRMFRWLCHALARALYPGPGDAAPAWPDDPADVEALVTLSGHHLVTPALAHALRGNDTVPPEAAEYLEAALYLNRQRNDQIVSGLEIAVR